MQTIQLICRASKLTGCYMRAALALNGLIEGISVDRYHILYFGVFLEIPILDFNGLSIKPLWNKYLIQILHMRYLQLFILEIFFFFSVILDADASEGTLQHKSHFSSAFVLALFSEKYTAYTKITLWISLTTVFFFKFEYVMLVFSS